MMDQNDVVYRPPSEASSLILRITRGCAHNRCSFCTMYRDRPFSVAPLEGVLGEIGRLSHLGLKPKRVFLADGNALCLPFAHLNGILTALQGAFPTLERVSCYGAPKDCLGKSVEELGTLKANGLTLVYMGLESGSDLILEGVAKGVGSSDMIEAADRLRAAGIDLSVTAISGLGGAGLWQDHADATARVVSAMKPQYFSLLTLILEPPAPLYAAWRKGEFEVLSPGAVLMETRRLLSGLHLENCVFRSNHASNYLSLKGDLPGDMDRLIGEIDGALAAERAGMATLNGNRRL